MADALFRQPRSTAPSGSGRAAAGVRTRYRPTTRTSARPTSTTAKPNAMADATSSADDLRRRDSISANVSVVLSRMSAAFFGTSELTRIARAGSAYV